MTRLGRRQNVRVSAKNQGRPTTPNCSYRTVYERSLWRSARCSSGGRVGLRVGCPFPGKGPRSSSRRPWAFSCNQLAWAQASRNMVLAELGRLACASSRLPALWQRGHDPCWPAFGSCRGRGGVDRHGRRPRTSPAQCRRAAAP